MLLKKITGEILSLVDVQPLTLTFLKFNIICMLAIEICNRTPIYSSVMYINYSLAFKNKFMRLLRRRRRKKVGGEKKKRFGMLLRSSVFLFFVLL